MFNEERGEEDYSISLVPDLVLVLLNSYSGRSGEVGGKIGIPQPPVGERPPGTIPRGAKLPAGRAIAGILDQRDIFQGKWRAAATIDLQFPILTLKTPCRAQLAAVHQPHAA